MKPALPVQLLSALAACALASAAGPAAGESPAREYLDQARDAARGIRLSGDQSAVLRSIACVLAEHDPQAALGVVAKMRRPSDAARSLGAVAANLAVKDPEAARQTASTAGRVLLRISDPDHRAAEQLLLLREIAALGEEALEAVREAPGEEARLAVVLGRAQSDPPGALELIESWELAGGAGDRALMAVAVGLARDDPDQALEVAATIGAARARDRAFWIIAEWRPAAEAIGVAQRVGDAVVRSAVLTSAAARMASSDAEAAAACVQNVSVARDSALAQLAVALVEADRPRAVQLARSLPEAPRRWALGRIAVELAGSEPEQAQELLAEVGSHPEVVRLAAARMAAADPDRAIQVASALPEGEARDAALASVGAELAGLDPTRAADLVWKIESPLWRDRSIGPVVLRLAEGDFDAATSLLGLVSEPERAYRLRSEVAAAIAAHDPDAAARLLESLPESDYRSDAALEAATALLSAGGSVQDALRLGGIGLEADRALRWLVPTLVQSRRRSPINLADRIENPYLRALSLADAARKLVGADRSCLPVPERARQIRPIVEWEGM